MSCNAMCRAYSVRAAARARSELHARKYRRTSVDIVMGFVFRLLPPRPTFAFHMTVDERMTMNDHVAYWSALAADGKALAFGPVGDPAGPYGIAIVLATDQAEAERLRDEDPAMRSGRGFRTELLPMMSLVTPTGRFDAV